MISLTLPSATSHPRRPLARLTGWLHRKALEAETEQELSRLNDHMLQDIGLTRFERPPGPGARPEV